MTIEVKSRSTPIRVWIDTDLKQQFMDFAASLNMSLTDFVKVSGTFFMNTIRKDYPVTLNVFTTNLKDAVRSKQIKVLWDMSKQGRSES